MNTQLYISDPLGWSLLSLGFESFALCDWITSVGSPQQEAHSSKDPRVYRAAWLTLLRTRPSLHITAPKPFQFEWCKLYPEWQIPNIIFSQVSQAIYGEDYLFFSIVGELIMN